MNVTASEPFEVECPVAGVPEPQVVWYFNGRALDGSEKSHREINKTKLVVKSAEESDKGNYACFAENAHGSVYSNFYVDVQ